jgi:hypothetical protein
VSSSPTVRAHARYVRTHAPVYALAHAHSANEIATTYLSAGRYRWRLSRSAFHAEMDRPIASLPLSSPPRACWSVRMCLVLSHRCTSRDAGTYSMTYTPARIHPHVHLCKYDGCACAVARPSCIRGTYCNRQNAAETRQDEARHDRHRRMANSRKTHTFWQISKKRQISRAARWLLAIQVTRVLLYIASQQNSDPSHHHTQQAALLPCTGVVIITMVPRNTYSSTRLICHIYYVPW